MNRRGFISLIGGLPFLGVLKERSGTRYIGRFDPTCITPPSFEKQVTVLYVGKYYGNNIHSYIREDWNVTSISFLGNGNMIMFGYITRKR